MIRATIYTRYSSTQQREASTEDQARNCRRRIEAEGWQLAQHFKDEAISGSTSERPGYQDMLKAAVDREFEVLVVDDLSRLSRDQVESERAIRRLEFGGIRIIGVSDGYDSTAKSRKVQRGVRGLMNEIYLDDLRDKTHRGLTGQAMKKYWAGGRPYGYRLVQDKDESRLDLYGDAEVIGTRLEVDPAQAAVVREVFEHYASDHSQRAIAAMLNARQVPSPGSAWRGRKVRRATGWLGSTIYSMLENQLYRGEYVWNRTEWRKNPDTGSRVVRARPESEWIKNTMPELKIVDDPLWQRVEARRRRSAIRGAAVSAGIRASPSTGRGPKFAFSGLLKCEQCGSSLAIVGGSGPYRTYGCSGHAYGLTCTNATTAKLTIAEDRLASAIKTDLLTPALLADLESRVAKKLATPPRRADRGQRIAELRGQVSNLTEAIATGALRSSPALGTRLADAEAELTRLEAEVARPKAMVIDFPGKLTAAVRKGVDRLLTYLHSDPHRARAAVREIVGEIPCTPDPTGKFLVARIGLSETLLRAVGGFEEIMVAGVGFEPTTFGL